MSTAQPHSNATNSPPKSSNWNVLWIMFGLVGGLLFFLIAVFLLRQQGYRRELNRQLDRIVAAKEPLDGAEMNAYYALPPNTTDLTADWLRVLAALSAKQGSALEAVQAKFPPGTDENGQAIPYDFIQDVASVPTAGNAWPHQAVAEAYLAEMATERADLHALLQRTGAVRYPINFQDGFAMLLPHLTQVRQAGRVLHLEAKVHLHRQDLSAACESVQKLLITTDTLQREPCIISLLVRCAIINMANNLTHELLARELTEDQLKQLHETWQTIELQRGFIDSLLGERASVLQTLHSDVDLNALAGNSASHGIPNQLLDPLGKLTNSRPGDCAKMLELLTDMVEATKQPFPDSLREMDFVETKLQKLLDDEQSAMPWDRHILTSLFLPATSRFSKAVGNSTANQRTLLAAIAMERYRLQNGAYATQLSELEAFMSPEMLIDPFNGQPLLLKQDAQEYVIYSVGSNNTDDGGTITPGDQRSADIGSRVKKKPAP